MTSISLPFTRSRTGSLTPRASATAALPPSWPLDIGAFAALLTIGVLAFGPVFGGAPGYRAAGGGVLLGAAIAFVSCVRRWSGLGTAVVAVVGYFAFGGALALPSTTSGGVIPTVDTVRRLALLTVDAWRDLLTVSTPASAFTGPTVVPYLGAVLCSVLAFSWALRARRPLWALAPAIALLLLGVLWGTRDAPYASWQGIAFVAIALCWHAARSAVRDRSNEVVVFEDARRRSGPVTRIAAAVAALAVAGGVAYTLSPGLTGADRFVLRDHVVPPLDLQAYPSPLTDFRYLERNLKETPLLTVSGLGTDQRLRLAVLDSYDGIVYSVAGTSADFLRIGSEVDQPRSGAMAKRSTLDIRISGYSGVWMPGGGTVEGVRFIGDNAQQQTAGLHYNWQTGALLTTAQVSSGAHYRVELSTKPSSTDAQLKTDPVVGQAISDTNVPDAVAKLADDYTAKARTPIEQLRAIETALHSSGYYSNGSDGKSRAGHTTERLGAMLELPQLIGDDEQYAAVMALMARAKGIPARVVMGFYPGPSKARATSLTLTGNDVHAWVEVQFQNAGWVAFDPTPDRNRTPQVQTTSPQPQPKPRVLPPPVPPKDRADPPAAVSDGKQVKKQPKNESSFDWAGVVRKVAYAVGGVTLVSAPLLVVLGLKRRRRSRRAGRKRFSDRVSGAWDEVMDRAVDLGLPRQPNETRKEEAARVSEQFPECGAGGFAQLVDAQVFGQDEPDRGVADTAWRGADQVIAGMRSRRTRWQRLRAAISLRSLRAPNVRTRKVLLRKNIPTIRLRRAAEETA